MNAVAKQDKEGGSKVGKFGIGVRVVDDEGDVGVIVGKRKGERLVSYDVLGEIWSPKFRLAVAANDNVSVAGELQLEAGKFYRTRDGRKVGPMSKWDDKEHPFKAEVNFDEPYRVTTAIFEANGTNYMYRWLDLIAEWSDSAPEATPSISPEIVVNDYFGADDGGNSSEWVPKVGDRVRVKIDNPNGGSEFGKAGQEVVVTELSEFDDPTGLGKQVEISDTGCGWRPNAPLSALEPLPVAEQPAAEVATTPFTIEAGKSYRTRDGRKAGPLEDYESHDTLSGYVEGDSSVRVWYIEGGKHRFNEANIDLVAEWVEPAAEVAVVEATATTKWEPAIGDKVRVAKPGVDFKEKHLGVEFVITNEDSEWDGERSWYSSRGERAGGWRYKTSELAPVTDPAPPAKFKVGDLLECIDSMGASLTVGKVYEAKSDAYTAHSVEYVKVMMEHGGMGGMYVKRFRPVTSSSPSTFARNDLVTLAAPVKVTGTSGDRVHISFSNGGSFTLPASALIAA